MKIYNFNNRLSSKNRIKSISVDETQNEMTFRKAAGCEDMFEISGRGRQKFHERNILDFKKIQEKKEKEEQRDEIRELIFEQDRKTSIARRARIEELKLELSKENDVLGDHEILSDTAFMLGSLFLN